MAYRYQVNFDKKFTAGVLAGRLYAGAYVRFVDLASALAFIAKCDGKTVFNPCTKGDSAYVADMPLLSTLK